MTNYEGDINIRFPNVESSKFVNITLRDKNPKKMLSLSKESSLPRYM